MIVVPADRTIRLGECLIWRGPFYDDGQPMGKVDGVTTRLHRRIYEDLHGALPPEVCVLRLCNRAACVEPIHMWAGTRQSKAAWDRLADPLTVPQPVIRDCSAVIRDG